jgi:hypothetical protein
MALRKFNKRGIYYIFDALLATILIIGAVVLLIKSPIIDEYSFQDQTGNDLLRALAVLRVSDINNTFIMSELADGNILDENVSVLEQIGRYWALEDDDNAKLLSELAFIFS